MSKREPAAGAKQSNRTTPHHFMNPQQNWATAASPALACRMRRSPIERRRLMRGMEGLIRARPPSELFRILTPHKK